MKARDLLATVRNIPDFPIMAETYRDCLRDVMDLGHLDGLLTAIEEGRVKVLPVQTRVPSPLASGLLYQFISTYMYEWDTPKAEQQLQSLAMRRELVEDLLEGSESGRLALKPEAVESVVGSASHTAAMRKVRTAEELGVLLLELGDLTTEEIRDRSASDPAPWLEELAGRGTIVNLAIPAAQGRESRWLMAELAPDYAFFDDPFTAESSSGGGSILARWFRWSGPVTRTAILDRYAFDPNWLNETLARLLTEHAIVQGHFVAAGSELEYCDRQVFEQLYRRTLNLLRREIQPVPLAAYQAFLLGWQQLGAARTTSSGPAAQVLGQLRGLALPSAAWEREVLPARGVSHPWRDLDGLVRKGDYAWVAAGSEGRAIVRFLARREGSLFLTEPLTGITAGPAADVLDYLKSEGASFFADIQGDTRLSTIALRDALRQLALAGVVTGEDLAAMSAVVRGREDAPSPIKQASALEEDLAARLPLRPRGRTHNNTQASQQRRREQRRLVSQRLEAEAESDQDWGGRWSLVNRASLMGPSLHSDERAGAFVQVALERYGLLTPEVVARFESRWSWAEELAGEQAARTLWDGHHDKPELQGPREISWGWGELSDQLSRMEMRGEVRRGYFIKGLSGVQYALPQAIESLRAARDELATSNEFILLSAMDPVNLYGGELGVLATEAPGIVARDLGAGEEQDAGQPPIEPVRFARVASTHVVFHRGMLVIVGEDNGTRIRALDMGDEVLKEALKAYLNRPSAPRRVAISHWNDGSVSGSRGEALLRELGATRSPTGLDYWKA
jgi:ATP-dependent helicase Lhr and Lhr-like helicase